MPLLSLRNVLCATALVTTSLGGSVVLMAGCGQTFDAPRTSDAGESLSQDGGLSVFDGSYDSGPKVIDYVQGVEITTLAGSATAGDVDGTGSAARFNDPVKLTFNGSGSLVTSDFNNGKLRQVTTGGVVTTLATSQVLNRPFGIAYATDGNLYVETDLDPQGNYSLQTGTLWRVSPSTGTATALKVDIGRPRGLLATSAGTLVLSDFANHTISLFTPATNVLAVLAGVTGSSGFLDGASTSARFNQPYGIAMLPDGNYVVADYGNNRLRLVTPQGTVSTFAGDGTPGYIDGARTSARFRGPKDVTVDTTGNVYVADSGNFSIRMIDTNGLVHTLAGTGNPGFLDGTESQALFYGEEGLALASDQKTLYAADGTNGIDGYPFNRVRKVVIPAVITTAGPVTYGGGASATTKVSDAGATTAASAN